MLCQLSYSRGMEKRTADIHGRLGNRPANYGLSDQGSDGAVENGHDGEVGSFVRSFGDRWWSGEDSNLRRRKAGRFTACCVWPLRYHSPGEKLPHASVVRSNRPEISRTLLRMLRPDAIREEPDAVWPVPELAKGLEPLTG